MYAPIMTMVPTTLTKTDMMLRLAKNATAQVWIELEKQMSTMYDGVSQGYLR